VDHVLKNTLVGRAGRSPTGDAGIGEDNVELPEIFGQACEEPLAIFRNGDVNAVATRVWSKCGNRLIERLLVATSNGNLRALSNESRAVARPMPLLPPVIRAFFPVSFIMPPFCTTRILTNYDDRQT
jgi:hypothetical protein